MTGRVYFTIDGTILDCLSLMIKIIVRDYIETIYFIPQITKARFSFWEPAFLLNYFLLLL